MIILCDIFWLLWLAVSLSTDDHMIRHYALHTEVQWPGLYINTEKQKSALLPPFHLSLK